MEVNLWILAGVFNRIPKPIVTVINLLQLICTFNLHAIKDAMEPVQLGITLLSCK